jgi:flagellar hook-length control protein FliK
MAPAAEQAVVQAAPAVSTAIHWQAPLQESPKADAATQGTTTPVLATVAPAAPAEAGAQDTARQGGENAQANSGSVLSQTQVVPVTAGTANTFAATLEVSKAASEAPARAGMDQALVDQIVQNASIAVRGGQQEFRIQLKPDFLGAMEVRVSVDNGVVSVRLSVESAATRQLIDNNVGQLKQAFGTQEVRVEHTPHFTNSSDTAWSFNQGGQSGWQGQNPYTGFGPLPEAIPFSGEGETSEAEAVAAAPASTQTPARTAPGAIDIQA